MLNSFVTTVKSEFPMRIQTPDPLITGQMLYGTELQRTCGEIGHMQGSYVHVCVKCEESLWLPSQLKSLVRPPIGKMLRHPCDRISNVESILCREINVVSSYF